MTKEQAIAKLKKCQDSGDTEMAHIEADVVLLECLQELGYEDIVKEWRKVKKWYV